MFYQWLGGWLIRRRIPVLGALIALALLAGLFLPYLRFDFRPEAMLQFSEQEDAYAQSFRERFGSDDNTILLVLTGEKESIYSVSGLSILFQLTEALAASEAVEGTYSLVRVPGRDVKSGLSGILTGGKPAPLIRSLPVSEEDVARVRREVERSQMLPGNLVSHDGSTAMVVVQLRPDFVEPKVLDPALARLEAEVERILTENGEGSRFQARFGGVPFVRTETVRMTKSEQLVLWPILGAIYFVLLLLNFRHPLQAALPLIAVGFATVWAVGLAAVTGQAVNLINNTIPTLILVVGVTNAIHVILRLLDEERRGAGRSEAAARAVAGVGLASLLTTTTTAIGFGSLLVAHSDVLRGFGWLTAASIMMTYVAIIVLLPILASFVRLPNRATKERFSGPRRLLLSLTGFLTSRPRLALASAVVLLIVCGALGSQVPVDAKVIDAFEEGHPIVETNQLIEAKLGGILPLEVDLHGAPGTFARADVLARVEAFEREVSQIDGVLSSLSLVDLLREASLSGEDAPRDDATVAARLSLLRAFQPEALAQFSNPDLSNIHITVRMPDHGNRKSLTVIEQIKESAARHFGNADISRLTTAEPQREAAKDAAGLQEERFGASPPHGATGKNATAPEGAITYRLTGVGYLAAVGLDTFVRDLFYSLMTATGVIFLVLIVVFRSLRVGLLSLLPNLLPLGITLALMPLFGYQLNTTTAVVFTISIGMSVDNSIHLLTRFREEQEKGLGRLDAIRETFRTTGWAIITSNLLLIAGFAMLLVSDFEPIRRVAVLTMTTIAASLLSALWVLPAELMLFRVFQNKTQNP